MIRALIRQRWSTIALALVATVAAWLGFALAPRHAVIGRTTAQTVAAPAVAKTVPEATAGAVREQCAALLERPASLDRDAQVEAALLEWAQHDPAAAMQLAQNQSNRLLRRQLLGAALRGWARTDAEAASAWVLTRPPGERSGEMQAVLQGAVETNVTAALALARQLVQQDAALAHDHGCSLIFALAKQGDFSAAVRFAATTETTERDGWLETAFAVWAEHQAPAAADAARALGDAPARSTALRAVAERWSAVDPRALVEFAQRLAPDPDRGVALKLGLEAWATDDLAALSRWLNEVPREAAYDPGVAAVAGRPPLANVRPEVALEWAQSICDTQLRSATLAAVISAWAQREPGAARHYADTCPQLNAADRTQLLVALDGGSAP